MFLEAEKWEGIWEIVIIKKIKEGNQPWMEVKIR